MAQKSRICAFTLIELIVVLAIVVLLLGLVLPTLFRVRQSAVSLDCQSRLRQIAAAELMYANDNNGMLTPVMLDPIVTGPPDWLPMPGSNLMCWQARLSGYIPLPPLINYPRTDVPVVLQEPDAYSPGILINCPERDPQVAHDSYALNYYMTGLDSNYHPWTMPWGYRLSQVKDTASIIMLGDCATLDKSGDRGVGPTDADPAVGLVPAFRHGRRTADASAQQTGLANFAFVDGHVESLNFNGALSGTGHWKWWK